MEGGEREREGECIRVARETGPIGSVQTGRRADRD